MKLTLAAIATALLATSASAMVPQAQVDPRDAAQGALGFVTSGESIQMPSGSLALDGRSLSQIGAGEVKLSVFKTTGSAPQGSDLR